MLEMVGQREMERIFEITDRLGLHRESLIVPLGTRGAGRVRRTPAGKIEIVCAGDDLDAFFASLEPELRKLL